MNKLEKILVIAAVIGLVCVGSVYYFISINYGGQGSIINLIDTGDTFDVPIDSKVQVEHGNRIYVFKYESGHLFVSEYTSSGDIIAGTDVGVTIGSPKTFKNPLTGFTFEITAITKTHITIRLS